MFSGVLPDCDVGGGRETHRHDYTRPPVALGDELGELSTSLELSASPSLILSTESVVVMEWKGMSTSVKQNFHLHPAPDQAAPDLPTYLAAFGWPARR